MNNAKCTEPTQLNTDKNIILVFVYRQHRCKKHVVSSFQLSARLVERLAQLVLAIPDRWVCELMSPVM